MLNIPDAKVKWKKEVHTSEKGGRKRINPRNIFTPSDVMVPCIFPLSLFPLHYGVFFPSFTTIMHTSTLIIWLLLIHVILILLLPLQGYYFYNLLLLPLLPSLLLLLPLPLSDSEMKVDTHKKGESQSYVLYYSIL